MKVNKNNMKKAAAKGFINATDLADYLVKKNMAFRDAYKLSGSLVAYCIDNNKVLEELSLDEFKKYSDLFENDVYDAINLENATFRRTSDGASSIESVEAQIASLRSAL
jgi:argininosuccinate lyase